MQCCDHTISQDTARYRMLAFLSTGHQGAREEQQNFPFLIPFSRTYNGFFVNSYSEHIDNYKKKYIYIYFHILWEKGIFLFSFVLVVFLERPNFLVRTMNTWLWFYLWCTIFFFTKLVYGFWCNPHFQ